MSHFHRNLTVSINKKGIPVIHRVVKHKKQESLGINRRCLVFSGQPVVYALLLSIKRLVITMTPATPTATATVPQPTATTMSMRSDERLLRLVFPF